MRRRICRNKRHGFLRRFRIITLANCQHLIDLSAAIRDGYEIVDLTQGSSVFLASDLCLLGYERSESFSLRHDAAGFHCDETARDRRRHS